MVTGSEPHNWHVLDVGSGPLYLNRFGRVSDAEHHWLEVDTHTVWPSTSRMSGWGSRGHQDRRCVGGDLGG